MRLGTSQASRQTYYDRNGVPRNPEYNAAAVAPHAFTQRWIYTVPAGKKAFLEQLSSWINRITAAAPIGTFGVEIRYTPNGGAFSRIVFRSQQDNTLQAPKQDVLTSYGFMGAGDVVTGNTVDLSTGGTVDYNTGMKASEFDA